MIGFLFFGSPIVDKRNSAAFDVGPAETAFRQGLAEAGYVEGRNVVIENRWAEGHDDRLPALAADLIRRKAAVIVATGSLGTALAAKAASSTIPIVFANGGDPVKYGLVASLVRPGGNLTGLTFLSTGIIGKRLDLVREVAPEATTVAFLAGGHRTLSFKEQTSEILAAGRALAWQVIVLECRSERDFEANFAILVERRAGALVVGAFPTLFSSFDKILELAARSKVPAIYPSRAFAEAGGLMSYSADLADAFRQLGVNYVGPILKGAKPADLPVQQPSKFELVINLNTAKALGLAIPPSLLARADKVIE